MSLPDPAATELCNAPRPQADNACRLGARLVWAVPRSLAATDGIACCFLFLGVLRWFTSPRWPSRSYVFTPEWRSMTSAGFSHSEILGSKPVCSSPRLIAAGRVLHRLSAPRHPPCTLSSLTKSQNCTLETSTLRFRRSQAGRWPARSGCLNPLPFLDSIQLSKTVAPLEPRSTDRSGGAKSLSETGRPSPSHEDAWWS